MKLLKTTTKNPQTKKYPNGGYALKSWQNAKEQFFRKKKNLVVEWIKGKIAWDCIH